MSDENYQMILKEVQQLREDVVEKLDRLEEKIKNEMKLKHQAIEFQHNDHERRLSFTEKVLFTTMGVILMGFLAALVGLVIV